MLYGILLLIIFLSFFSRIEKGRYNKQLFTLAVIALIIFCWLRDPFLYPDIGNYYDFFIGYTNGMEDNFGLGYTVLNTVSRSFTSSFYVFMLIVAIIIISSYAKIIKDYSPYIWLPLLLYLLINYYPSFFLLRQYIAMSVFLFSIKYVINRNPWKFGILSLIAISFHLTAVVILPFYFLYGIKFSKMNMLWLLLGSVLAILMFMRLSDIIGLVSAYYMGYFESEMDSPAWQRALMKIYIMVVYLFSMRQSFYDKGINRVVFYCMLLNVIICVAAMNMYGVFRMREFFSLADYIGITIIIQQVTQRKVTMRPLFYSMVLVYIVLLFMSFNNFVTGENMNNQYQFYWEGTEYRMANTSK